MKVNNIVDNIRYQMIVDNIKYQMSENNLYVKVGTGINHEIHYKVYIGMGKPLCEQIEYSVKNDIEIGI